ncbi:MAG: LPS export ABC transporter permease LptF [Gammaproteobacteria bacterium]|nr:LPS export ABC transporter permease LptF [Gammaproteobacteria bacterium]
MIIRRYLYREILQTFAAVLAVFLVVGAAIVFVRLLAEASSGSVSGGVVLRLLLLKLLGELVVILPASLFVAILLGLGRMYKDSEVVAMWAGGVGAWQIVRMTFWFLLAFAVATGVVSLYLSPEALAMRDAVRARAQQDAEVTGLLPGTFMELRDGDVVAYVSSMSPQSGEMQGAFAQLTSGVSRDLLVAKRASIEKDEVSGDRYVILEDGWRYSGTPGSVDYVIYRFERHGFNVDAGRTVSWESKSEAVRTQVLIAKPNPWYVAELNRRLSHPVSVLLLGLLAVALARTTPGRGRYAKLVIGIAIYFVYSNAVAVAQNLVNRGVFNPVLGIWSVHLAMAVIVAVVLYREAYPLGRLAGSAAAPRPA